MDPIQTSGPELRRSLRADGNSHFHLPLWPTSGPKVPTPSLRAGPGTLRRRHETQASGGSRWPPGADRAGGGPDHMSTLLWPWPTSGHTCEPWEDFSLELRFQGLTPDLPTLGCSLEGRGAGRGPSGRTPHRNHPFRLPTALRRLWGAPISHSVGWKSEGSEVKAAAGTSCSDGLRGLGWESARLQHLSSSAPSSPASVRGGHRGPATHPGAGRAWEDPPLT